MQLSHGGGLLAAVLAAATLDGRRYGIASLAIADGRGAGGDGGSSGLAGAWLYWGCSERRGRGWRPPPAGWHTDPARSKPAGVPPPPPPLPAYICTPLLEQVGMQLALSLIIDHISSCLEWNRA